MSPYNRLALSRFRSMSGPLNPAKLLLELVRVGPTCFFDLNVACPYGYAKFVGSIPVRPFNVFLPFSTSSRNAGSDTDRDELWRNVWLASSWPLFTKEW